MKELRIVKAIKNWQLTIHSQALRAGILLLVATLFFFSAEPQPVLAQGLIQEEKGTLVDFVASFSSRIIPGDSEMYVPPSDTDLNQMRQFVSQVVISASTNDVAKLSEYSLEASHIGYELIKLTNEKTGTIYYILREAAGQNRGWGLYVFRAGNRSSDLVIEAPHPIDDLHTDKIGVLAFTKSKAKALLLAGAHRQANRDGSADVAHTPRSIFQVVHEVVTKNSTTVIQIHGFTLANEPGYPQIVLSSSDAVATSSVKEFSSILEAKNITTGIANGGKLRELEAATNIQGRHTNSIGATFIHMELESSVRNYPSEYKKVIAAIGEFASKYLKEPRVEGFPNQLKQELWYYITAALVMIGAFIMLLLERRHSKL